MADIKAALLHGIDPFSTSVFLYNLVTISSLVDMHFRLLELGASNINVSKGRFFWHYVSSSLSYFIRTIFGMLVLVLLVCLVTAIITAMIKMFASGGKISKQLEKGNVSGASSLMEATKSDLLQTILKQMKISASYIMTVYSVESTSKFMKPMRICKIPELTKLFLIVLPLYMVFTMTSYVISFYKPISRPDEETKKSSVMSTYHHSIYFTLVLFIILMIFIFVYTYMKNEN